MARKRLNQISPVQRVVGFVLVFCVGLAAVVFYLDIGGFRRRIHIRGKRIIRTKNNLRSLALDVCAATRNSGEQPPADIDSVMRLLDRHFPGRLEYLNTTQRLFDPATGSMVDSWGSPVRLVVMTPHEYRLISFGPNGKQESGEGDDIVYDFDPWEGAKPEDPNTGGN
ncbi:MAG: hypothetical protein ACYS9T_07260 [Planctomycetota bacterium]|jgi:hypothetical protein